MSGISQPLYHFWTTVNIKRFALGPLSCLPCLSIGLSICNVDLLWPNGWMD